MPRVKTIAVHKDRAKIEKAILAGETERSIASRFGLSRTVVHEYKTSISGQVAKLAEKRDARMLDYIQELEDLRLVAVRQLQAAQAQDFPFPIKQAMILQALASAGQFTDRLARFTGQTKEPGTTVNIQLNVFEQMPIVRATLEGYPDALAAVDRALREALNGNGRH